MPAVPTREHSPEGRPPRRTVRLTVLTASAALLFALLAALGTWQVQRLGWKHDLIARVEARAHGTPVAVPDAAAWPQVTAATHEYLRVRLHGQFLHDRETLVQAATEQGGGFWVLTPLQQADGSVVIVNRGFVPPQAKASAQRGVPAPEGIVDVEGLLRITEPHGGFLRTNDPAADRWFSRDLPAIAQARGLPADKVAPFFVDAAATPGQPSGTWPQGGLTVLRFPDNHLVYALTWYALALMVLAATVYVWRHESHRQRNGGDRDDRGEGGDNPAP